MSGKRRRPLLERVRRILNQAPQQQHQVMEKITATFILLALLALVGLRANSVPSIEAAFAQIADIPSALFNGQDGENQIQADSLPKPKSTRKITREDESGKVEAEYQNGELTRLNIDGKEIPASEFEQHEDLLEELAEEVAPPTPPVPPMPPGAPDVYWFRSPEPALAPTAPFPPMPPLSRGGISIVTDKDGDGNTIIHLDNHGNSSEVVVKNGEVWVNGKKLEKGEELEIPGIYLSRDGHSFYFDSDHGEGMAWGDSPEERAAYLDQYVREQNKEMERAMKEGERALEQSRRDYERDMKRAEKEWKDSQKNWEKEQKSWEKEQRKWEKEQEKWQREQENWQKEQERWEVENRAWEAKSRATQELLKKELLKDGLISDPNNFSMKLNAKELKVNKKKQSEALRRKYEELLRSATGTNFEGDDWNYNFNFSGDN